MILKLKEFQDSCKKILEAVDSSTKQVLDETIELKTIGNTLHMNVTNGEYYVEVIFNAGVEEELHATINATKFLSLVSKLTTEDIELKLTNNALQIIANGTYKLPLIYGSTDSMYVPKQININNVMSTFSLTSDVLLSILNFNSKELNKGTITRAVQKMFYIDQEGCITFTSGACVNSFKLDKPIKMLLTAKLVKLFKLFEKDADIKVSFGYDEFNGTTQAKVKFETPEIIITSILTSDEVLLNSVPVSAIRRRAFTEYPYNVEISKAELSAALDRLSIFSAASDNLKLEFTANELLVSNLKEDGSEVVSYQSEGPTNSCAIYVNLKDFKMTIDSCIEQFFTISYGDGQALVISRGSIKNVIPEGKVI